MRPFYLFLSLLCIIALTACGTEEEITPPAFSNIMVNGAVVASVPYKDSSVIITGNIDDFAATIIANSTITGERAVDVDSSGGSWSFEFSPLVAGLNGISFTASDKRGNFNQMILTVNHDPTPPNVTGVVPSVADPEKPLLIVTFDEVLLESSLSTTFFRVVTTADESVIADSLTGILAGSTVTLTLPASLPAGSYRLICPAITDLAGNGLVTNSFDFTIAE